MKFKIKYHVVFEMDYGSTTKRYGNYILVDSEVKNSQEAEEKVTELFNEGKDPELNPFFNFTRGKILSKKFVVDDAEGIEEWYLILIKLKINYFNFYGDQRKYKHQKQIK